MLGQLSETTIRADKAYSYVQHIVCTDCTIRECAKFYSVSPSTVYVYATSVFNNAFPNHFYSHFLKQIWNRHRHRKHVVEVRADDR